MCPVALTSSHPTSRLELGKGEAVWPGRTHVLLDTRNFFLLLLADLLEFRAVALKTIAIKDVSSVRYLCMSADGKIYGLVSVPPPGGMLGAELGQYLLVPPASLLRSKRNFEDKEPMVVVLMLLLPALRKVMAPSCSGGTGRPAEPSNPSKGWAGC